MKNLKEVKAYKLSNGEIIQNQDEAIKKQKDIEFKEQLDEFLNDVAYSGLIKKVRPFIIEHADKIFEILDCRQANK